MVKKVLAALMLTVVVLFAVPTTPAIAAPVPVVSASVGPFAQQTTAPPGPRIDPSQTDRANAEKTKSKVVVAVIALVLAGIVVWGRHIRRKRRKSS